MNTKSKIIIYCVVFLFLLTMWGFVCAGKLTTFCLLRLTLLIMLSYIAMIIDVRTKQVPNILILIMITVWLLLIVPIMFFDPGYAVSILTESLLGLLTGGGMFLLVYIISKKGLGGGDVKFIAAAGLFLGFSEIIPVILYGTILAAITGVILILAKKIKRKDTMPLVPFLFAGIIITAFIR